MKKGDRLFVRVDYKVENSKIDCDDHADHLQYVNSVASETYLLGGGFSNTDGGMMIFSAKDFAKAKEIAEHDPLIKSNFYRYELFEWELVILSNEKNEKNQ